MTPTHHVGRGETWRRTPEGCELTFYGGPSDEEEAHEAARVLAENVRAAFPHALVRVAAYAADHGDRGQTSVTGYTVHASVSADDVAAFPFGPTHRKAIGELREAVARAQSLREWMR